MEDAHVAPQAPQELESAMWADACFAAEIFALLVREGRFRQAGILVKGQAGPVRDIWLARLKALLPSGIALHPVPVNVSPERLIGGLDLGASLAAGQSVETRGILAKAHQGIIHLPMADLAERETLSAIASAMDSGDVRIERDGVSTVQPASFGIICFDESASADDSVNRVLTDRLMLHIDVRAVSVRTARQPFEVGKDPGESADISDGQRTELCQLAAAFGLSSMRPAMQAIELAKAIARLDGQGQVQEQHIAAAVRIGLVHRAQQMPALPDEIEEEASPPPPDDQPADEPPPDPTSSSDAPPEDMVLDAVKAALPHGLLAYLQATRALAPRGAMGRRGAAKSGGSRGRPLSSRKGALTTGQKLDLIATLKAAIPWQKVRQSAAKSGAKLKLRPSDIHVRRYKERTETSTIFVVDASGSTAMSRLGEAKGAIELLLGESYARRDHVALISFRGREAQILLPPTRALVRAKRSLSSLPGGGGTPLASGLKAAMAMADEERRRGREASIVIMTDGSANVDVGGNGGRKQAAEDARTYAKMIGTVGIPAILIDIARRSQERARELAVLMNATYVPMPFANSKTLSDAVQASR